MANTTAKNTKGSTKSTQPKTQATAVKEKQAEAKPVEVKPNDTALANENQQLKQEMAEMKAQMELMMKMMANSQNTQSAPIKTKEKNITFVNMTTGTVVLRGNQSYKIEGQFAKRSFLEREARLIVNNMPKLITSGMVYITDAEFVAENDLSGVYQNILNNEQLAALLTHDASVVVDTYQNVSPEQQSIIIDMVIEQKLQKKDVDANILMKLGQLSGKDLINYDTPEDE